MHHSVDCCDDPLNRWETMAANPHLQLLFERIQSREAVVGIIGQGYVGLPLALTFVEAGFRVIGFDLDEVKIEALNRGESHIRHVGAERVADAVTADRFSATSDFARLAACESEPPGGTRTDHRPCRCTCSILTRSSIC